MRDFYTMLLATLALTSQTIAQDASADGEIIDMRDADSATWLIGLGTVPASQAVTITLRHGDESDLSDAATVPIKDALIGASSDNESSSDASVAAAAGESGVFKIGYVGIKRYVRVRVTTVGGASGVTAWGAVGQIKQHIEVQ
jgi:hypothetical protein